MEKILAWVIIIIVTFGLLVSAWYLKREVNSWLYYDGATIDQVCEMVKPEYIKDGYCEVQ